MGTEKSTMAVIRASRPTFRNSQDKLAFAVHSAFLAASYVLNRTGPIACVDVALTASSPDEAGNEGWNSFEDSYAFVYSSPDNNPSKVLLKCRVVNNVMLVDALKHGSSTPVHQEINVADFVQENEGTNYTSQYKSIGNLVNMINTQILRKLSDSPSFSTHPLRTSSSSVGVAPFLQDSDRRRLHARYMLYAGYGFEPNRFDRDSTTRAEPVFFGPELDSSSEDSGFM